MKATVFCSMIALGVAPLATLAEEVSSSFSWGDLTFQPRVYAGYANYTLEQSEYIELPSRYRWELAATGHNKLRTTGPLIGIGGTLVAGRFFGDIYYQTTPNETAIEGSEEQNPVADNPRIITRYLNDTKLQHADWAISLGYMITDKWSGFVGYKAGNTEWDQTVQDVWDVGARTNIQFSGKFDQDGPFLGTSYSFPVGPGVLTLRAAYAYLQGTAEEGHHFSYDWLDETSYNFYDIKFDGNSNAYSVGISWTQDLANNLGFSIGANYHNYQFDMSGSGVLLDSNNANPNNWEISNISVTEELFTLTASIFYRF